MQQNETDELILQNLRIPAKVIASRFSEHIGDEDLIQDCYLAMVKAAPKWNGKSKASTFFWRVCVNAVWDALRSRKPGARQLTEANNISDPEADRLMGLVNLKARIKSLPDQQRDVLEAIIAADYSIEKAAAQCGVTAYKLRQAAKQAAKMIGVAPDETDY